MTDSVAMREELAAPASAGVADVVRAKLEQARDQLIERNLRNKLVNCALSSKRSRQVRVVDELSDEVFKLLWNQRREMTFAPGRGLQTEDAEEAADPDYGVWTPPETDETDEDGVSRRHRDRVLQTQLTAEGLQKRLTSLYYEIIESEQEQGVNVLYLALGFVKWFEDGRSEVERYAPLLLLPVELVRKGARERFQLKARDEDLYSNVSLKVWLSEQHSIEFPELPDSEDWLPSTYFEAVRQAIAGAKRWEVADSEILLGFFSFNKFLLWRAMGDLPFTWEIRGRVFVKRPAASDYAASISGGTALEGSLECPRGPLIGYKFFCSSDIISAHPQARGRPKGLSSRWVSTTDEGRVEVG